MDKRFKFSLSITLVAFAAIISIQGYDNIYRPWSFGFLYPFTTPIKYPDTTITGYIITQRRLSMLFLSFGEVTSEVLNTKQWAKLPGFFVLFLYAIATLRGLRAYEKVIIGFAAVGGPIGAVSYTINLYRGWYDLIIIWTMLLLILAFQRRRTTARLYPLAIGGAGLLLWITHYAVWPFIIIVGLTYAVIDNKISQRNRTVATVVVITIAGFVVYPPPSQIYLGKLTALLSINIFDLIGSILTGTVFSIQGIDTAHIVNAPPPRQPSYMPEITYILYLPFIAILCVLLVINIQPDRFLLRKIDESRVQANISNLFIAISIAFGGVGLLYLVSGYLFRTLFFWPIIITFAAAKIYHSKTHLISYHFDDLSYKRMLFLTLVCISIVHLSPLLFGDYFDNRTTTASPTQIASGEFGTYIPGDERIYTDLIHASVLTLRVDHQNVQVGHAITKNGVTHLSEQSAILYEPERANTGYLLVTTDSSNVQRVVFWEGSKAPTVTRTAQHMKTDNIYTNKHDKIYLPA